MRRLSLLILLSAVVVGGAALFEPIVLLRKDRLLFHGYLGAMVFLAWITVFSGAYIVCFFVGLVTLGDAFASIKNVFNFYSPIGPLSGVTTTAARRLKWTGALLGTCLALTAHESFAGPPFRTDDPEPVELRHWEFYTFSTGTRVEGDTSGTLPGIEFNYGAAPNLQLHVMAPLAFDDPSGGSARFGYGDTELGVKYRLVDEDDKGWRPQLGIFPLVELATGSSSRGLGAGHTRLFLPVWVQKSFDDWTTYGGGGYWWNPGTDNKDYWFYGWLLQRKLSEKLTLGGEVFYQTADTVGGRSSTGFNIGSIYDFSENHHLLLSVGRGIKEATTSNELSYYVGFQWTQ